MNKIPAEVARLNLDEAEAFFAITIHRVNGRAVPTATVIADTLDHDVAKAIFQALLDSTLKEIREAEMRAGRL